MLSGEFGIKRWLNTETFERDVNTKISVNMNIIVYKYVYIGNG